MLSTRRAAFDALLGVVVFFLIFGAAFHTPAPPIAGLDPSWMVALGEAARDHLVFGREISFTYGPLGYVEVPGIVTHTYAAKTLFALSLALASALLVLLRVRSEGGLWQRIGFILGVLVIFPHIKWLYILGEGDVQVFLLSALIFTFPAFAGEKPLRLVALLLGFLAGFVSLIKFSLYIAVLVVGLGTLLVRAWEHNKLPAVRRADVEAACLYAVGFALASAGIYYGVTYGWGYQTALALLGAAGALCWVARSSGIRAFSAVRVPLSVYALLAVACCVAVATSAPYRDFVYYSLQTAAGYSSAGSREAHSSAPLVALLLLGITALLTIREKSALGAPRLFAVLAILVLAFKQDFVRQDDPHMAPYFLSVSLAGCILMLGAVQPRSAIYAAFLVALALPVFPEFTFYGHTEIRNARLPATVTDGLRGAFQSVAGWRRNIEIVAGSYKLGLMPDLISPAVRRKLGSDPVDLVGNETNIVFANGLRWRSRPEFLPYSVLARSLDALNRDSMRSGRTGRELFTYDSVDNRYPLGDEPMTSRELLCNYATDRRFPYPLTTRGGDVIAVLRREPGRCGPWMSDQPGTVGWNEWLPVRAPRDRLTFLFIDCRYSVLGDAFRSLYQIAPVWVVVRYQSGSTAKLRVLPELLTDGLLVNPIPKGMEDVHAMFSGFNADPVDSVQFTTERTWLFSQKMHYELREVRYRPIDPSRS